MKGIVFTEFLEMVETGFGLEVVDEIVSSANLPSGGAYAATGTYDHAELVSLVVRLSKSTEQPVPVLVKAFGEHMFGRFVQLYPVFFAGVTDAFIFLESVDSHIHQEVTKLYPDAELPRIFTERSSGALLLTYRSARGFGDLAHGLIVACLRHFGCEAEVSREDLSGGEGKEVRFEIRLNAA